jgi:hypothetical protein
VFALDKALPHLLRIRKDERAKIDKTVFSCPRYGFTFLISGENNKTALFVFQSFKIYREINIETHCLLITWLKKNYALKPQLDLETIYLAALFANHIIPNSC